MAGQNSQLGGGEPRRASLEGVAGMREGHTGVGQEAALDDRKQYDHGGHVNTGRVEVREVRAREDLPWPEL